MSRRDPEELLEALDFSIAVGGHLRADGTAEITADLDEGCAELYALLAETAVTPDWDTWTIGATYYRDWVRRVGRN